jgi:hypothetical protein
LDLSAFPKEKAMRRAALGLALVVGFAAGCIEPQPVRSTSWSDRLRTSTFGKDIVQLDVALLERPVGDPFLNKELWNYTDEQTVPPEQKATLDDNGFRVGQIVGMPPGKLQALWSSERSCINPRTQLLPPGRAALQILGPTLVHADFQVKEDGQAADIGLDQAQFVLEVVPTLARDGRTRLRFTPKVLYGEKVPDLRPDTDGSNWIYELNRPSKHFPAVAWEVSVAPNEYLVVGGSAEQPQSLGYQAFVQQDASGPVQRLLVIRTNRSADSQTGSFEDLARSGQSPPLAEQATAVRAHGP